MKAVFIPYNQAFKDRLIEMMNKMNIRGFTLWSEVQGRGSRKGEPHYGDHAWPTMNSAIITMIPDEKVDDFLKKIHELDIQTEMQGIHAFVWDIEKMV
jgi:nitrogen regulatory protein PII